MSTRETLIERLNTVLSWELAGTIQYLQGAALVTGPMRPVYADFLQEGSKEARGHAEDVASRIVALGGVPTVEPAAIRTSTSARRQLPTTATPQHFRWISRAGPRSASANP